MIKQLREFYTEAEAAAIYARPYDHTRWEDHKIRVSTTIHLARWMRDRVGATTGADLSAGDGAILRGCHFDQAIYGDRAPRPPAAVTGEDWRRTDIEAPRAWEGLDVGLLILSETLEHVEAPRRVLAWAREACEGLVLSTPCGEWDASNPEHYWGWDADGVRGLLLEAGFAPVVHMLLDPQVLGGYTYQLWGCV